MKTIKIPNEFTLREKGSVKGFIKILNTLYQATGGKVCLDFTTVRDISRSDFMVLFALLEKIKRGNKDIKFYRKGKTVEKFINGSVLRLHKDLSDLPTGTVKDMDNFRMLEPSQIARLANNLTRIGLNRKRYASQYERVETLLTEIFSNALEHGIRNRDLDCFITVDVDNRGKKVSFTFVDMGKGIAYSHRNRESGKLPWKYRLSGDSKIVHASLAGELPSSTGESNRGKGLPEISEIVKMELVSEFELITNKVFIDYSGGNFHIQGIPNFAGTYYCWSVTKENFDKWVR